MMNIFKTLSILGVAMTFVLNSCESTSDEEGDGNPLEMNLSTSEVSPGSFEVFWNNVDKASWYFVQINQNEIVVSDFFDGDMGQADNYAEISYTNSDIKAGETYKVNVKASTYLSGGTLVGEGSIVVTTPDLPTNLIGTWNHDSSGDMIFNSDGTFVAPGYSSNDKTWTISGDHLVIITQFTANLQFETYTYTLSNGGNTLTLVNTLTSYTYILNKL